MICALELYKYFGAQDPLRFGSRMHKAKHNGSDDDDQGGEACFACKLTMDGRNMLLCEGGKEGCHAACHTYCCSPPLTQIPASETGSVRGVHEWPHLGRPTRACVTMACTAVPSGDQPAMALRRPSGSREDVTTTAVVAEAVEARET